MGICKPFRHILGGMMTRPEVRLARLKKKQEKEEKKKRAFKKPKIKKKYERK